MDGMPVGRNFVKKLLVFAVMSTNAWGSAGLPVERR